MNRTSCLITLLAIGLCCPFARVHAATPTTDAEVAAMDADLKKLLAAVQPKWTATAAVEGQFGYNDNLLLSHTNPEHSTFARGGFETLLWRVPNGRIDYFGFLNGQRTYYFNAPVIDAEGRTINKSDEVFAGVEWRYRVPDLLSLSMDGQAYYLDQIFDVSDTDLERLAAQLKVVGAKVGPTVRWNARSWLWLEARATGNRENFRDGLNNATITESVGRVGWTPSDRFELSFQGAQRRRAFDRRTLYSGSGQPSRLDLLVVHEREWGGRATATWGRSRHWKTTARADRVHYQDSGLGYLNYMRDRVGVEVEWSAGAWLVRAESDARRKNYEVQTLDRGISPPKVVKDEYDATVHVERTLSDRWTLLGQYRWERSRSNDVIASYEVNEGLLGIRWSWEK